MPWKIGKSVLTHLPVATKCITAVIVIGLPAIIDDYRFHAEVRCFAALFLNCLVRNILMKLVPRRI